jgi:hypothetical protein
MVLETTLQPVANCASSTVGLAPPHHVKGDGTCAEAVGVAVRAHTVREAPYRAFESTPAPARLSAAGRWRSFPWAPQATRGGSTPGAT